MSRVSLTVAVVCVQLFGVVSVGWPQGIQTSLFSGQVFDPSGAVIEGAQVTLRGSRLLGGERHTETDERGAYRFPALAPGDYEVTASYPGFASVRREEILVPVGAARIVDFELPIASVTDQVIVGDRVPAVDVSSSALPTRLDQNLLRNLPVSRALDDLINLAPGVTREVGLGGTESSNAIYINGVQTTDPKHQDPLIEVNHNWLEQMEVAALGASAEYGGFTGVLANGIVKSGSNRFSSLGEYWTTRPGWVGDNTGSLAEPREILSLWDSSAQVGGPIVVDKLWFFSGVQFSRLEDQPAVFSSSGSTTDETRRLVAKLDAAMTPDFNVEGLYQQGHSDSTGVGLDPSRSLEATDDVQNSNHLWNVRFAWVVSGQTLIEGRTGGYTSRVSADPRPPNSRLGPSGVFNFGSPNTQTVSSGRFSDTDRGRGDVSIGLTRYTSVFGQPHDLKFGVEYETTTSTDTDGIAGGQFIFTLDGEPFRASLWDGDVDEATSRRGTVYVRDRWSFTDRVTLNLGVRLDLNRASVPVRGTIFSTNPVSPRAGVAWAVTADHATVVRAHYGRYHDSILTRRIADMDTTNQNPVISASVLPNGDFVEVFRRLDAENTTIDDGLRHSYVDQYVLGIERELVADLSVQAQYVRRNFDQFMGVINTNTIWTPRQVRDPGPDGRRRTADDGELFTVFRSSNRGSETYLYTNPEGAFRRYDAIQLIGAKRYSHNWQMQASYTWSRSQATVGNLFGTNAGLNDLRDLGGGSRPGVFSIKRPRFSWTRIKGESNVQGGRRNGSVEGRGTGRGIGADGGSPEGDWSPCRRGGGRGGLPGAGAAVERQPEARRGVAATAWRIAGGAVP